MSNHRKIGARRLGLAASAVVAVGLVTAGPSVASASDSTAAAQPALAAPSDTASVANDTLTVAGSNGPDQIGLNLDPVDPNTLVVDFGSAAREQRFDRGTFTRIAVSLGSGDDVLTEQQGAFADELVVIDAGNGDDTVVGGDATDVIFGAGGHDKINSGKGDDLIFGGNGSDEVDGGVGRDTAFLDSGRDSFIWDPGDGSDVIDGGSDVDTLVFNGASANENMSLSANGHRSVFLRDPGAIRMDMDNVERLDLNPLGGADTVTVNDMTGTGFRHADVDLSVAGSGDGQPDIVTVNGTDAADHVQVRPEGSRIGVEGLQTDTRIAGGETIDQLDVNGLGGNDTVHVGHKVASLIGVDVDLGSGQL